MARRFDLIRYIDDTGISGTGCVAQGVEFNDGVVAMRWLTQLRSTTLFDDIETVNAIHGHDGHTRIMWRDRIGANKGETIGNVLQVLDAARRDGRLEDALAEAIVLYGGEP